MFLIDVTQVSPLEQRKLKIVFADGLQAILNMDDIIKSYQGVFEPLLDYAYFQQVCVHPDLGTIYWPNGADICPDVLYSYASKTPIIINGQRVLN